MVSWIAEGSEEDLGRKGRCVVMGGAHQIFNSRNGMEGWTAEGREEDFGRKERCVVMGWAHQTLNSMNGMES